jgi:serine/threonine protein kinase
MANCPSCQAVNPSDAKVCLSCGNQLDAPTLKEKSVVASRYELLRTIGSGGMGTVYEARDMVLDEIVAIKFLRSEIAQNSDAARRFRSEIKLARKVTHPNVCRIHEYGEDGGVYFISMEYVDGVDLRRFIRASGGLAPEEAFEIALQTVQGLAAIHAAGIVHRDLKTLNLMRDKQGVVRLMDFGIAKQMGGDAAGGTATGVIIGTPEYMSPEQAQGGKADFRSDVYSLGIVLFEIFTGNVPFKGETPLATILKQMHETPSFDGPEAAELPQSLVPILKKALEKKPADRYSDAAEMTQALYDAHAAFVAEAPPQTITRVIGADESKTLSAAQRAAQPPSRRPITPRPAARTPFPPPTASSRPSQTVGMTEVATVVTDEPTRRSARTRPANPIAQPERRFTLTIGLAGLAVAATLAIAFFFMHGRVASPPVSDTSLTPIPTAEARPTVSSSTIVPSPTAHEAEPAPSPRRAQQERPVLPRPTVAATPDRLPVLVFAPPPTPRATIAPTPEPRIPRPPAPTPEARSTGPAVTQDLSMGYIQLVVVPFADVTIDDKPAGRITTNKLPVAAGAHIVRFIHPDFQPLLRKVNTLPGETVKLVVDLKEDAIVKKR